ncbi:MAG: PEGA domain-containing protein [Persicimonas sp.]
MLKRLIATGLVALLVMLALPAFAQDGKEDADSSGASVVILQFETFNVDQEVMDQFYVALHDNVDAHEEMHVTSGGDVSIDDLILTLGCEDANTECLRRLDEFVDGDRIVFGSVQHSEGVYLLTLEMFDFDEGEFVRQVTDETVEGDGEQVRRGIEGVIQGFLYGDVGELEVSVTGAEAPTVSFDGEELGRAPLKAEDLPLGEHAVTLKTSDGREQSKKVVLKRGSASKVRFEFDEAPDGSESTPVGSKGYIVPGWGAVGVGTIGLLAGVVGTVQVGSFESEASSMVCGDALCSAASPSRANKLQDDMDSAYTMSMIGYSVAAVGLAAGGYLLYEGYFGGSAESAPADSGEEDIAPSPEVSFGIAPRSDGASLGLTVGF